MTEILALPLLVVVIFLVYIYRKKSKDVIDDIKKAVKEQTIDASIKNAENISQLKTKLESKDSEVYRLNAQIKLFKIQSLEANRKSLRLGQNIIKGELVQILASFSLLAEYDSLALISSVSKQASFDIIGVTKDRIDFIEVKTNNAILSPNEINIQRIIESNCVNYRVIEGKIPQIEIHDRVNQDDSSSNRYSTIIPKSTSINTHSIEKFMDKIEDTVEDTVDDTAADK